MKSRVVLFFIAFGSAFVIVIARLFYIQCLPNEALERLKKSQYMTVISLPSQRGKILDRKGEELATSVTAQSLYADPAMIEHPRQISKKLASLLSMPAKEIYPLLTSSRRFVWIRRRLDPDVADEIKKWHEPSLHFVEESRRAYPNKTLLSQVLGFVGADGEGLEGVEKKYDNELRGEQQSFLSKRDARGRPLVVNGQIFELHADGDTIETTVDKDLQYELERELESVTEDQRAEKATGIIMDPSTGEILAMASYPTFDPTSAGRNNPEYRRDRAISDIYEPGSTFKVVTVAAALRTGRIQPNTKYFCENGKFKIGTHTIHEALPTDKFGLIPMSEILAVSSNIGVTKIAFDVGQKGISEMIHNFGFGLKTGVDLMGEATGLLTSGLWPDHLFSNIAFGQGVGVTALQMANAYSTIANGGKLMKPFLIKRVTDSDQHLIFERTPEMIRQVLSAKESSILTLMLSGATEENGTGKLARVDGYPVAGKTGTAQKVNPNGRGYIPNAHITSFAGFVPANNPQFTIYIAVDTPKKHFYGADVAAPVFNHLAAFALNQRGFMPIVVNQAKLVPSIGVKHLSASEINDTALSYEKSLKDGAMPNFSGLTVRDVGRVLQEYQKRGVGLGSNVELIGSGTVESQWPQAGQKLKAGQKIRVIFHSSG